MYKICSESTIKAQEQHEWCCSGVFIVSFRGMGIEDPVELYDGAFFAIQQIKAKIFNWVLNTLRKILWAHLFKSFKKTQKNQTIWWIGLSRIRKI